jgi:hypothetical protein
MGVRERRTAIVLLVTAGVLCSAVGGVAATQAVTGKQAQADDVTPPAFVVALSDDGTATVTVTYTFDLTDDDRRAAFEELRTNETATRTFEDRFRQRLRLVAADGANATGREMSVTDVSVAFETAADTGVVRLTATWEGLAATDGDRLVVTEPFASGFEPERRFVVLVPDGHAVDSVTPAPDDRADGRLEWAPGTPLDGFEVTAGPAGGTATPTDGSDGTGDDGDGGDGTTAGGDGSGFDVAVGLLALLTAAVLAFRGR